LNRTLLAALSLALLFFACTGKSSTSSTNSQSSSASGPTASIALDPSPPKAGHEKLTVTVKDADGNPVRGATVKIATNMPMMTMKGPDLTAHDKGDGTYVADADLKYATSWTFDATVTTADGKTAIAHLQSDVK
jgi:nitrogen fixation protein FixH